MKIAVCVTARNRPDETKLTIDSIKKYLPKNGKLFLVDDASLPAYDNADYRFETNVGIPRAKNKCIELALDWGADHVFLLDNDVIILQSSWWKPYVESKEPHLQGEFVQFATGKPSLRDNRVIYQNQEIAGYGHARGFMLYFDKLCFERVGGFDTTYGKGMYEHGDLSNRIYNVGLTSFRFQDVHDSESLFKSLDHYREASSSIDPMTRRVNLKKYKDHYARSWNSTKYCEFREFPAKLETKPLVDQNNIILTNYLVTHEDTQRGKIWEDNLIEDSRVLLESAEKLGLTLVIQTDSRHKTKHTVMAESYINPYFQRWLNVFHYLRDHPEVDNVFVVDCTDVEVLHDPFPNLDPRKLYVGDEPSNLNNRWLHRQTASPILTRYFRTNTRKRLINCGVVGGTRQNVMQFAHDLFAFYSDNGLTEKDDMPTINYVAYTKWGEKIEYGRHVTTLFKKYDYHNREAWFRHK